MKNSKKTDTNPITINLELNGKEIAKDVIKTYFVSPYNDLLYPEGSAYSQFYKPTKKRKGKLFTMTIEVDVAEKFENYCKENAFNKSKLIESLLKKYISEVRLES